jgi:hypothetical protein
MLRSTSFLLASLSLSGCFSFEFNIATRAEFSATADGSGDTILRACFREGFNIGCSDANTSSVTASSDGEETTLFPNPFFGVPFDGILTGDAPGKEITFSWVGRDGSSAPASVVTLPDAFEIVEPVEGSVFLPTDEVRLVWDPSPAGEPMQVDQFISCSNGSGSAGPLGDTIDTGEFLVPSSVMQRALESDCTIELTLTRVRQGTLDPAFGQSESIEGRQSRTASFIVSPQ